MEGLSQLLSGGCRTSKVLQPDITQADSSLQIRINGRRNSALSLVTLDFKLKHRKAPSSANRLEYRPRLSSEFCCAHSARSSYRQNVLLIHVVKKAFCGTELNARADSFRNNKDKQKKIAMIIRTRIVFVCERPRLEDFHRNDIIWRANH